MNKKLSPDEIRHRFRMNGELKLEEVELLQDAMGYNNLKWGKVDKEYFAYLREYMRISDKKSDLHSETGRHFYYKGLQGLIELFHPRGTSDPFITFWIWVEEDQNGAEEMVWREFLNQSAMAGDECALYTALDINYGGTWDEETRDAASLIIYG